MKSTFVTLAILDAPSCAQAQLILNLAEMWMSLVFQTLTSLHLDAWLPGHTTALWSGNHLNVALPLWQGFTGMAHSQEMMEALGGRANFQQYLASEDPVVRAWAEHARDAFNDLRNSPDPEIRKYWWDLHEERMATAKKTWAAKKAKNAQEILNGIVRPVSLCGGNHGNHQMEVSAGSFKFTISQKLGLDLHDGNDVTLQYHLTSTAHPSQYATEALATDPASRLGVSIRGQDSNGDFHCWLTADGILNVKKMNTLVDTLEGLSLEESCILKRRWHADKQDRKTSGRNMYT